MEEFEKILDAAVKAWGIERYILMTDKKSDPTTARGCVAYIVKEYYPYLIGAMSGQTGTSRSAIYKAASATETRAEHDERIQKALKRMMRQLKLIPRKKKDEDENGQVKESKSVVESKRVVSCTKQLFGFDYTEEEELRYKRALEEAPAFWEKMSRIGRQPLEDGMVFSLRNSRKNRDWYNG